MKVVEAQSTRWIYRGGDLFAQRARKLGNRRKRRWFEENIYLWKEVRATPPKECETDANQGDKKYQNRLQAPGDDWHDGESQRRA